MNDGKVIIIPPEWIVSDKKEIVVDTRIGIGTSLTVMLVSYMLIIYILGPRFMKSRPAYQLKGFMIFYNIFQIIACIYLSTQVYLIDLPALQFGECVDVHTGQAVEKDYNHICDFLYWLKAVELIETVVFVLRKKQQQVSFLHVFHHTGMLFLSYNLNFLYRSSAALLPIFINSCVHVIMYTYYLMSAVLPKNIVALLTPFKKVITIIQMVQFTIILLQVVVGKSRGCQVPEIMLTIYTIIIMVIFYGFYDFYRKSYATNEKQKAKIKPTTMTRKVYS